MKLFLTTASAIALLSATAAFGNPVADPGAASNSSAVDLPSEASAAVTNEAALAVLNNGLAEPNLREAEAEVGDNVIARAFGNEAGSNNLGTALIGPGSGGAYNQNIQFTLGNNNAAVNSQTGTFNESATLQIGDENQALVRQNGFGHEAAIAQVGNVNEAAVAQEGDDHGAAMAQLGDDNKSFGRQVGGAADNGSFLAHGQFGNDNMAVTFQSGQRNTAATLQIGDDNHSFISQGGGNVPQMIGVDTMAFNAALPVGASVQTSGFAGSLVSNENAAASLQLGTNNRSGIIQHGSNNSTVNYQNNL